MRKIFVSAATIAVLVVLGSTSVADYYATKADYRAGKLTAGEQVSKAGSDDCISPPILDCPGGFFEVVTDTGDTTGAASDIDSIPLTCNGNYSTVAGPDHVYALEAEVGNALSFQLSTTDPDYDPSIYVVSTCTDGNTCITGAAADSCLAVNAAGNPCANSNEAFVPVSFVQGTFFFVVDSFYSPGDPSGRDSGPYRLDVTGPCPVELLEFSVE